MTEFLTPASRCSSFHILIMAMAMALCAARTSCADRNSFHIDMVYRYSEQFNGIMKARGTEHLVSDWQRHGYPTPDFYHRLATRDHHRHISRNLLAGDVYSFYPNNQSVRIDQLAGLHYSIMHIGTPSQSFLVALDTGSDLLWVPCDCKQCSPTDWTQYGLNNPQGLKFAVYSPSNSSTSKTVACNDAVCTNTLSPGTCVTETASCTYSTQYLSANTSSSGTIVQDVLLLNSESSSGANISTKIYFGCGKVQTGGFLNGGAPDGLLGLGPDVYSVPTIISKNLKTDNVFSMCFNSDDGSGRLVFGRKAGSSLQSTPLLRLSPSLFYAVKIAGFVAAGVEVNMSANAIFDTGTSLTTLPTDVIKPIGDAFSSKFSTPAVVLNYKNALLFSYCWNASVLAGLSEPPSLSVTFAGAGTWSINDPFIGFGDSQGNLLLVCLAMVDSGSVGATPIIGFNFMGGYEYFFDQDAMTLSWGPSNCYSTNGTSTPKKAPTLPVFAPEASPPMTSTPSSSPKSPKVSLTPPSRSPSNGSVQRSLPYQILFLLISASFFL